MTDHDLERRNYLEKAGRAGFGVLCANTLLVGCLEDSKDEEGPFVGEWQRKEGPSERGKRINEDDYLDRRFELSGPGKMQYKVRVDEGYKENPDIGEPVRIDALVMTEDEFNQYFVTHDKTEFMDELTEARVFLKIPAK